MKYPLKFRLKKKIRRLLICKAIQNINKNTKSINKLKNLKITYNLCKTNSKVNIKKLRITLKISKSQ